MFKPLVATVMVGIGLLLANTPSVWCIVAYIIPAISFVLLIICIRKFIKGG
jgi:hypothetical protein